MLNIRVEGLALQARIGWFDWEREQPQILWVDAVLKVVRRPHSDALVDTVDYATVVRVLRRCAEQEPRLIERLVEMMRDQLLDLPMVQWAEVVLHKPLAAAVLGAQDVSVSLSGERPK